MGIGGWDKLQKQLAEISSIPEKNKIELLTMGSNIYAEEMRRTVAVDTGELRDSIHVEQQGDGVAVLIDAGHAGFVEFGTVFQSAQPFIRPAMDNKSDEVLATVGKALENLIKDVA